MLVVEGLISRIWYHCDRPLKGGSTTILPFDKKNPNNTKLQKVGAAFPVMTYTQAMSQYGSDKPDLRYRSFPIQNIFQGSLPEEFVRMITSLESPTIDFIKVGAEIGPAVIREFLDSSEASAYRSNSCGPPAVLTYDTSKPLYGLAPLGHELAERFLSETQAEPGDTFIFQAREGLPFQGGSTVFGGLRSDLIRSCIEKGLIKKATRDTPVWIIDFPMFRKANASEPGQGSRVGLQANHHPFTAPKSSADLFKLSTDPLNAVGDHYDLVINGVEVGGGSKRIHNSIVQEYVFRDILQMAPESVEHFRHLLEALRAGCPPHAGIALGFDRLMTILLDKESVREVIAFPKWGADAEDKMVKSPAAITDEQLKIYHLTVTEEVELEKLEKSQSSMQESTHRKISH